MKDDIVQKPFDGYIFGHERINLRSSGTELIYQKPIWNIIYRTERREAGKKCPYIPKDHVVNITWSYE